MKKRLLIAVSLIGILIVTFYIVTASKKQQPVEITTPTTPASK